MITNNHKLIIVLGMAHSGTTIFVHTLLQNPSLICFNHGTEAWLYENEYLLPERAHICEKSPDDPISKFIVNHPNKNIILKRPWQAKRPEFFAKHMPNATYFLLLRSFEDLAKSWSKPTSNIAAFLRDASLEEKRKYYDQHYEAAMNFKVKSGCQKVNFISFQTMIDSPKETFDYVNEILNLEYDFSLNHIGKSKPHIKKLLKNV